MNEWPQNRCKRCASIKSEHSKCPLCIEKLAPKEPEKDKIERLTFIIQQHSEQIRTFYCGDEIEKLISIMNWYEDKRVEELRGVKTFRDEMIINLRALALVIEMSLNASTHGEKNARLRGTLSLIESQIDQLQKQDFDFTHSYYGWPEVWRADYPHLHDIQVMRQMQDEIEQLKAENKALKEQ